MTFYTTKGDDGSTGMLGEGRVPKYRHYLYEWLGVEKVELSVMTELLLRGYRDLLAELYRPEGYLRRCQAYLRLAPPQRGLYGRARPLSLSHGCGGDDPSLSAGDRA